MNEIDRLTPQLLSELEQLLRDQKAPIVRHFHPGATDQDFGPLESYLGLPLPKELRQWWEWHDGTDATYGNPANRSLLGPLFLFYGTARALGVTQECRKDAEEVVPEDPDSSWGATWLAIGTHGMVACQCAVEPEAPVPVLDVNYHKAAYPGAVAAQSLGEMVRWWIEALESGAWRYDDEHGRWERQPELVSPERESTGLV